ncbi:MAG: hypothetical protein ABIW17_00575 [Marmoricola sp.]
MSGGISRRAKVSDIERITEAHAVAATRAKVGRGILRAVRGAVGSRIAILTKLNMSDGVSGGITLEEAIQTASGRGLRVRRDGPCPAV